MSTKKNTGSNIERRTKRLSRLLADAARECEAIGCEDCTFLVDSKSGGGIVCCAGNPRFLSAQVHRVLDGGRIIKPGTDYLIGASSIHADNADENADNANVAEVLQAYDFLVSACQENGIDVKELLERANERDFARFISDMEEGDSIA